MCGCWAEYVRGESHVIYPFLPLLSNYEIHHGVKVDGQVRARRRLEVENSNVETYVRCHWM